MLLLALAVTTSLLPAVLAGDRFVSLTAYNACAVTTPAAPGVPAGVKCWGAGQYGIIGQTLPPNVVGNVGDAAGEMSSIPELVFTDAAAPALIELGGSYGGMCGVFDNGKVLCWGTDSASSGGNGVVNSDVSTLSYLDFGPGSPDVVGLAGSTVNRALSNCAIFANGGARCWGRDYGNLGISPLGDIVGDAPGELATLSDLPFNTAASVTHIALSSSATLFVFDDGTVRALGQNAFPAAAGCAGSYCGDGPGEVANSPAIDFGTTHPAIKVEGAPGSGGACVLFEERLSPGVTHVKCFGGGAGTWAPEAAGVYYTLGDDTVKNAPFITFAEPTNYVVDLSVSSLGVGFVFQNGKALTIGEPKVHAGDSATLVIDAASIPYLPFAQAVVELKIALAVACAYFSNGGIRCWGTNQFASVGADNGGSPKPTANLPYVFPAVCGDGIIELDEVCDDNGTGNGDGCSDACAVEPDYICEGTPSVCVIACGNGVVNIDLHEQCDDGNTIDNDGCTGCLLDADTYCEGAPSSCGPYCEGAYRVTAPVSFTDLVLSKGAQLDKTGDVETDECSTAGLLMYDGASKELFVCDGSSSWLQLASTAV